jgi:hypothetical protein
VQNSLADEMHGMISTFFRGNVKKTSMMCSRKQLFDFGKVYKRFQNKWMDFTIEGKTIIVNN